MAGNSTVLSAGRVTVSTTGYQTTAILSRLNKLIAASNGRDSIASYNLDSNGGSDTISVPSPTVPALYVVPSGGVASIDLQSRPDDAQSTFGVVLAEGTTVTLTGGDANTAIASQGVLDYTGNAGLVDAFGDNSTVDDAADGASIGIGGAGMNVTFRGVGQDLFVDSGTTGTFTQTGSAATIQVGVGSDTVVAADDPSAAVFQLNDGNAVTLGSSSTSSVLVLHGSANTISAMVGSNVIYAQAGGDVYFGNPASSTLFYGASTVVAVSTVFGGDSGDSVYGGTGVDYTEGAGDNVFSSGVPPGSTLSALHSTVTATTGHDTLFGSVSGDQFNLGNGSELFVGGGGADTMFGGSITPTVFGASGENLQLVATRGALAIAFGDSDTIDASLANQGSTFFAINYREVGNTTLVGSMAAPSQYAADTFVVGSVTGGGGTVHTITIDNFQAGDSFYLSGYSAADDATFQNAVDNHPVQGGGLSFTLSDNTTVQFTNTHPTQAFDGGKDAL